MTNSELVHCLESYKKYLLGYQSKYTLVNETPIHSSKAVKVLLFCIDFDTKEDAMIEFWVPIRMSFPAGYGGCNAKIPTWLAIKNIDKEIEKLK